MAPLGVEVTKDELTSVTVPEAVIGKSTTVVLTATLVWLSSVLFDSVGTEPSVVNEHVTVLVFAMTLSVTAPALTVTETELETVRPEIGTVSVDPETTVVPTTQFTPLIFVASARLAVPLMFDRLKLIDVVVLEIRVELTGLWDTEKVVAVAKLQVSEVGFTVFRFRMAPIPMMML
jgi:hypothetical protein